MSNVLSDIRQAFRLLVKNPLFSIVAISTLALGIGLNAATFSAIHGLLLRPLGGVLEPERLVQVYRQWPGIDYGSNSIPHYQDVRDRSGEVFESTAAWFFTPMSLSAEGRNERLLGIVASANFFQTYGVGPALGRTFVPGVEDRGPGAHAVTVLGYSFFQARFAGDARVIGRTIDINGHPFEVVGVAPPAFKGPMAVMDVPLYVPLMMQAEIMPGNDLLESRGNNMMSVVARLREGKTIEDARQMMDVMLLQLREELPDAYEGQRGTTLVYQSEAGIHPTFRSAQLGMSTVMMVVVSLLLLIACVNVANLFLARARERRREMGIRISLGAGRRRILQQLFTESLLFSLLAGIAGVGLAVLVTRVLSRIRLPIDGPFSFDVEIDTTVLAFTMGVSILAGLVFGLAPALQAARSDLVTAVRGLSSGGRGRSRVSGALVVCQMALSLVLLVASGLFLRALESATEIRSGHARAKPPRDGIDGSRPPGLPRGTDAPVLRSSRRGALRRPRGERRRAHGHRSSRFQQPRPRSRDSRLRVRGGGAEEPAVLRRDRRLSRDHGCRSSRGTDVQPAGRWYERPRHRRQSSIRGALLAERIGARQNRPHRGQGPTGDRRRADGQVPQPR